MLPIQIHRRLRQHNSKLYVHNPIKVFIYYLYITGQNGYSGKIQKEYVIAQKDISDAAVEVTLQDNIDWDKVLADAAADPDNASATLTSCIKEVKDTARTDADAVDGVKNLVEGTDYTISLFSSREI